MRTPLSIYIHIPFCVKKCNYCAFTSSCVTEDVKEEYIKNLIEEIKIRSKTHSGNRVVESIYIGGGTPSVLRVGLITELLETVYKFFVVKSDAEITIECNPSSLTIEKAKEYKDAGITRVSMGLQSKQDHHLKFLGRLHTADGFKNAVKILKSVGLKNINGDMIIGIPNQTKEEVAETVKFLSDCDLTHISMYMLEVEEGTKLKKIIDSNLATMPTDSEYVKLYNTAKTELEKRGFNRYEVSNFSKEGFRSKHNFSYWMRSNYLGFGVSAHSFVDGVRMANTQNLSEYISHIKTNEIPLEFKEELTKPESAEEEIMLKLRTVEGLNLNDFSREFGAELIKDKKESIKSLVADGFLKYGATGNLIATDSGFMVLNKIISLLID